MADVSEADKLHKKTHRPLKKVCSFSLTEEIDDWLLRYSDKLAAQFPQNKHINKSSILESILEAYREKHGNV